MSTPVNSLNIEQAGLVLFDGVSAFTATTTTQHDVLIGGASNTIANVAPSATAGVALVSAGAASNPSFGTVVVAGGGTGQVTLTNHGVLVGAGTNAVNQTAAGSAGQVLQSAGGAADPTYSTATYPSTTTANQILYSSANNTVGQITAANSGVLTTGGTGTPSITQMTTNGSVIVGSASGPPLAVQLTAGTGVTITNAANSITINSTATGFSWVDVTGATQLIAAGGGYLADFSGSLVFTLPATSTLGDTFAIATVQQGWSIAQGAGQQILFGTGATTAGVTGSLSSNNVGDTVTLVATNTGASSIWMVLSSVGNLTVA